MKLEFHPLRVSKIVEETNDARSIFFEVPDSLASLYQYKAGQYLTVKFQIGDNEQRRAYSICTSPLEAELAINVKRVHKGVVSNHIHDNVKEGDLVDVMQPDGRFTIDLDPSFSRDFYFFAAGSGITPIISIIKTTLEQEPKSSCFLCYGNRSEGSIIFDKELSELEERYNGQFFLRHTLSRPDREKSSGLKGLFSKGKESWTGWKGRIDNKVDQYLDEHPGSQKEAHYFICGPGAMIDTISDQLERKEIADKNIHVERFVSLSAPSIASSNMEGSSLVKVHLSGKEFEVSVSPDKTILDVLIDEKYDPPYSCTSGACSTCIAKLIQGKVEMDACYALDDDEVRDGYILVCQSHPQTDTVELTFDT